MPDAEHQPVFAHEWHTALRAAARKRQRLFAEDVLSRRRPGDLLVMKRVRGSEDYRGDVGALESRREVRVDWESAAVSKSKTAAGFGSMPRTTCRTELPARELASFLPHHPKPTMATPTLPFFMMPPACQDYR
jgi:hypothetical protein